MSILRGNCSGTFQPGPPDQVAAEPEGLLRYSVPPEFSYFEVEGDTITKAIIGWRPALPFG